MNKGNEGRILGIDFGTKRIGIAICDEKREMAFPLQVLENNKTVISTISRLIKEKGVNLVVIGESKNFKMEDNPIMDQVRIFESALTLESGVNVDYEPEFLTSHQAHHVQGKTKMLDASAATIILQSYLDRQKNT